MKIKTTYAILTLLILNSCDKEPSNPDPIPAPAERQLNLKYIKVERDSKTFELIISDSSGNYLVDTIAPVEEMLTINFKSNETKYNITTIERSEARQSYKVNTYYQVYPDQWALNQRYNFAALGGIITPSPQTSTLTYYNVPTIVTTDPVLYQFGSSYGGTFDGSKREIRLNYNRPAPYYSFLLIPSLKLYKFYETVTGNDSVNLSTMDIARSVVYNKPFQLSDSIVSVVGFRKKDDISTYLMLYFNQPDGYTGDLLYPPAGVEQYLIQYSAVDKKKETHYSFVLDDKVPASMEFLDDTYLKLTKKADSDFEIEFPRTLPSFYYFTLYDQKFDWKIYLPTGKRKIQLNDKLVDLRKSKMLNTYDFSLLKTLVGITKANNYDFEGYLNAIFDPAAASKPQKVVNYMDFRANIP
jgi:hypothetical protein